jgi:hypothetical protein
LAVGKASITEKAAAAPPRSKTGAGAPCQRNVRSGDVLTANGYEPQADTSGPVPSNHPNRTHHERKFLGTCILTASLPFSAAAQAQSAPDYASIIEQAHQKYKSNHDGKVADYIPALASYSPNNFAITLATVEGKIYQTGDDKSLPMESLSKVFTLALAMEQRGRRRCWINSARTRPACPSTPA